MSAVLLDGPRLVVGVAASYAVATLLGGALLLFVVRRPGRALASVAALTCARIGGGVVSLVVVLTLVHRWLGGPTRADASLEVAVGGLAGLVTYRVVEHLLGAPELGWWGAGLVPRAWGRRPVEETS
jgi:hypothetical protein